ncbi:hypothetical protein MHSWG343_10550 [Candidatus Mycoplasma haematohominis]|uniref:Uncharacterized protein n=1 Tax=Candidatus Mycoplasma haematohominis TaxID=1494318 RepID=A0A478FS58_9MOLU|nr:hypothetical protein MHSWG343_10550 [Candidatus Mycoplasma haemohominis]
MASPAAVGAGVIGGSVAVAGTSYAAYTQLRPYDDFLDYANRNWYVYIGEDEEKIASKIKGDSSTANTSNPYKAALKKIRESLRAGTGSDSIQDADIDKAGKSGETESETKLTLVKGAVKVWCEANKKNKPAETDGKIDWSNEKMKENENWKNFAAVCLESTKKN